MSRESDVATVRGFRILVWGIGSGGPFKQFVTRATVSKVGLGGERR